MQMYQYFWLQVKANNTQANKENLSDTLIHNLQKWS